MKGTVVLRRSRFSLAESAMPELHARREQVLGPSADSKKPVAGII